MFRVKSMLYLTGRIPQLGMISSQAPRLCFSTVLTEKGEHVNEGISDDTGPDPEKASERPIGWNITRKEKIKFLTKTLLNLDDSKDAVYGTLDSWVAWEQNFPIAALKNVLLTLEKEQQWHRVVQVTKWLLSKGQANTMGTYRQLIRALDMDHRAEEAHQFWVRKIGHDLHPVPWQLCSLMISIYYRNNMFENLVKLFKSLEAFGRKPPEKSIVQKVVNAYEILGMEDEKERMLQKYADLQEFTALSNGGLMTVFLRNGAKALLSSHQLALPPPNPHSPVASHGAPSFLRSLRHRRPPQGDCGGGGGARIRRRRQVRNPGGGCLPVSRMLHPPPHSRLLRSDFQVSSLLPHPSPCSSLQETLLASISFAGHEFNFTFPKLPRSQICGFPHFGGGFRGFCTGKLEFEDGDVDCEKGDEAVELIHQCSANPAEVDRICKVIEELFALDRNMEAVLDECGIQLTSDLVVDVLQRFKHARKPAFRFFCWADRMPGFAHDSRSFNAMMSILGKSRQFETMVSMLGDMGKRGLLTMETFTIAIRAFASAKERKKSVGVFELMNKYSFKAGVETFNCLLDSLGREKLAKEAELLFEKLKGRFTPNLQTYTVLLNAWCKSKNLLEAARVWNEMVDRGFKPDVVAHNIMLDALLKVKKKADAIKLFEVMRGKGPAPNVRSYTVLIRDFCKQGKMTEAAAYLDEMASSGLDPDAAVYTCLITGFGNLRKMGEVYELLREMEEKGCAPDGRTYNALIKLLTSRRMADEAVGVYNKMVASGIQPSIHTYNMIMKACFVTGKDEAGQAFWAEMGRSGCCPDENSYTVLIRGLVKEGRSELACRYVEEMIDKGMRIPEIDYCKFVADFARCGHPNVLEELAEKMRDSGKAEVSEVFARWAQIAKRGAKRRDPLRVLW